MEKLTLKLDVSVYGWMHIILFSNFKADHRKKTCSSFRENLNMNINDLVIGFKIRQYVNVCMYV
jgi:hypothetical protein